MADSLVVIRSGATDYDLQGRIRGTLEMPLCAEGVAEAHAAAAACSTGEPLAVLYTSPASCAVETSRIIGRALDVRPRRVEGLGNFDQGLWQGMLVDDIRRKQPRLYRQWQDNPWAVAPPEGERSTRSAAASSRSWRSCSSGMPMARSRWSCRRRSIGSCAGCPAASRSRISGCGIQTRHFREFRWPRSGHRGRCGKRPASDPRSGWRKTAVTAAQRQSPHPD